MLFRSKKNPIVPLSTLRWQIDTFAWLMRHTGGIQARRKAPLILPIDEFFPDRGLKGEEGVRTLFERVRTWAGMADWPCELRTLATDPPPIAGLSFNEGRSSLSAGSFSVSDEPNAVPVITYDSSLQEDPMALVATFAHELGHYLCATFPEAPPGGTDLLEPATDVAAVFLGFGVFLANAAFSFEQLFEEGREGWQARRHGYLTETELLSSLAIFCTLSEVSWREAAPHLDPHLPPLLKQVNGDLKLVEEALQALREPGGIRNSEAAR
jgi:hypothetical protein